MYGQCSVRSVCAYLIYVIENSAAPDQCSQILFSKQRIYGSLILIRVFSDSKKPLTRCSYGQRTYFTEMRILSRHVWDRTYTINNNNYVLKSSLLRFMNIYIYLQLWRFICCCCVEKGNNKAMLTSCSRNQLQLTNADTPWYISIHYMLKMYA